MFTQIIHSGKKRTLAILTTDKSIINIGTDCPSDKTTEFLKVLDQISININKNRTVYAHFKFTMGKVRVTFSADAAQPKLSDITYIYKL